MMMVMLTMRYHQWLANSSLSTNVTILETFLLKCAMQGKHGTARIAGGVT